MATSNNSITIIGTFLAGAVVGGVLGLLLAPAKGSETRKKIVSGSGDLSEAMKKKMNSFMEELKKDTEAVKDKASGFMNTEKDLNAKIMKITMEIKEKYPELSKYIEEMQDTIPDQQNPEVNLRNLKTYYESLNSMMKKYMLEHCEKPNPGI